jgi:DNA-binding XRE family transcriptional regulator
MNQVAEPIDKWFRTKPLRPVDGPWPNRLQEQRIAVECGRKHLARTLKTTEWTLKRLETGHVELKPALAEKIAAVLKVAPETLFGEPTQRPIPRGKQLVPVASKSKHRPSVELAITVDGRLVGGVHAADLKALTSVLKQLFGDDDR